MTTNCETMTHWLTLEMLSRYAEAVQAGLDTQRMYPSTREHLAACALCRSALGYLLIPFDSPVPFSSGASPGSQDRLHSLAKPATVRWGWRPGSHPTSFGLQMSLSAHHLLLPTEPAGHHAPSPGGRRNFTCRWPLANQDALLVQLEAVATAPGQVAFVGWLTANRLPQALRAYLFVGCDVHHADVQGGELRFEGVALDPQVERIGLMVETL